MKRYSTIICCICFAIGGFLIAATNGVFSYNKTAKAANTPVIMQYPKDLWLGHTNNVGLTAGRDTIHDTVPLEICCIHSRKTVYKTKWRTKKVFVPDTVGQQAPINVDTMHVSRPTLVIPITETDSVSL